MEVHYNEQRGCMWVAAAVFSLGLVPLLNRRAAQHSPVRLTEEEMILRNGRRIPWSAFTRVKATNVLLNGRFVRTQYALTYPGGTIRMATDYLRDADAVVAFVLSHVPPEARQA